MKKYIALFGGLALLGAGCAVPGVPVSKAPTLVDEPAPRAPVCAQTPQVYFFNKLAFSAAELASIQTNVVDRMQAHYGSRAGFALVSVFVKRTATGIVVDAIIDQPESTDPVYEGFVLNRLKDGTYPAYEPVDAGPGYEG